MKQKNTIWLNPISGFNDFLILTKYGTRNLSRIFKRYIFSVYNKTKTTIKNKVVVKIALFLMLIFSIAALSNCMVTTYGKSPERLENDEIKIKIYSNLFAKVNDVLIEEKLKLEMDKELSENKYLDYIVLDRSDVTYTIKLFKSIQDKFNFMRNIQDKNYLDSLKYCPNCHYSVIDEQIFLFEANNIRVENLSESNLLFPSSSKYDGHCRFAKGSGNYYLAISYASGKSNFIDKHTLSIILENGDKIQLNPYTKLISKYSNSSATFYSVNTNALENPNIPITNSANINLHYSIHNCLYQISLEDLQKMAKYKTTSILLSSDSKDIIKASNISIGDFTKNNAKYILSN